MKTIASASQSWMPSRVAESLCRQVARLIKGGSLSPEACQQIYYFCGVRPGYPQWRSFLLPVLSLLGLLSLVAGAIFFIAWNWAMMPKMAKFALTELLIVALAMLVWWRWYDGLARSALLAAGLGFGALFALYGQVYQTGADSWELFSAWLYVLLPLSLIARQDSLWFCSWLVANLAFQFYFAALTVPLLEGSWLYGLGWLPAKALYSYLFILALCLAVRETLALRALKYHPSSWLTHRWFSRLMAGFLLLLLTSMVVGNIFEWDEETHHPLVTGFWLLTLLAGYYLYRYRFPDLGMLTLGIASSAATGCVLIAQLLNTSWESGVLFLSGCLMVLWLAANGALLLYWRRRLYEREQVEASTELTLMTEALQQHGLLSQQQVLEIQQQDHSSHLPWYLRLALSLGSWGAAIIVLLLLILILYVADMLNDPNGLAIILPSLILAALARGLLGAQGAGKYHIGLAWAIAATYGLCFGLFLLIEPRWGSYFLPVMLCTMSVLAVMAIAMPSRTYRFMAITALTWLSVLLINDLTTLYFSPVVGLCVFSALVAGVVIFWSGMVKGQLKLLTGPLAEAVSPLLYGIPAGLILLCFTGLNVTLLLDIFWEPSLYFTLQTGLGAGIAAGLLISTLYQRVVHKTHSANLFLSAAIFCGAVAVYAPGIGLGLWLLMLARYQGSRVVLLVTVCLLLLYVSGWYYFLGITLLQKSLLLFASGVVLLVMAFVARLALPVSTGGIDENR
ncbi:DUF2157 domain-containing protein [Erwinia sp.]|uniref:DUF2157 domain-containing protein n=1 Tax=Erwinia citreus TaxID=558 RepID=UPI003C71FC54